MRAEEPHRTEPPPLIDLRDEGQVAYWSQRLEASLEDLRDAVREVGPHRTAVAIWLGRGDAV